MWTIAHSILNSMNNNEHYFIINNKKQQQQQATMELTFMALDKRHGWLSPTFKHQQQTKPQKRSQQYIRLEHEQSSKVK